MSTPFETATIRRRLRGTHRVLFAEGATEFTALASPYLDLGNVVDLGIQKVQEKTEDSDYIGGRKVPVAPEYHAPIVDIMVKLNDMGRENLKRILQASDEAPIAQSEIATATAIDALDFTTVPAVVGAWYHLTSAGEPIYDIETVTIAGMTEGTHYELLRDVAQIRFYATQSSSLSIEVTAKAVSVTPMRVGTSISISGMANMRTFIERELDEHQRASIFSKPFGCFIDYEDALNMTVDANTEATLKLRVTTPEPVLLDRSAII